MNNYIPDMTERFPEGMDGIDMYEPRDPEYDFWRDVELAEEAEHMEMELEKEKDMTNEKYNCLWYDDRYCNGRWCKGCNDYEPCDSALNKLIKNMINKGILFRNEDDGSGRDMYECCNEYLFHNDKYVVTIYTCNVLDPELIIYDINTLNKIGTQYLWPQMPCERFNENKWGSFVYDKNDEDIEPEEDEEVLPFNI